jgi:ABC-type amino acid transport substrate-binding protein
LGQNGYQYTYYSDKNLLLNDLELEMLDAGIMSEYDALSYKDAANYTIATLSESPIYFVVNSKKQTFYDKLNQALEQMKNDGTIARLKKEYIQSINQ